MPVTKNEKQDKGKKSAPEIKNKSKQSVLERSENQEYNEWLKRTVKQNLRTMYTWEPRARTNLAEDLGVSLPTVSKWTADNNAVPNYNYLSRIASHFGVSVDWILTDHTKENTFKRVYTYSEAFRLLQPFIERGFINPRDIKDEVLCYLLTEEQRIVEDDHIPDQERTQWISDVMKMFDIPMPDVAEQGYADWLYDHVPELHSSSQLKAVAKTARALTDNEEYSHGGESLFSRFQTFKSDEAIKDQKNPKKEEE